MRWLSPPDSVPAVRDRVRYSSPTSTRNCSRSLISFRIRWAISRCFGVRLSSSAANQRAASAMEKRVTSPMCRPPTLTHSRLRLQPVAAAALAGGGALELAELLAEPGAVGFAPASVQVGQHAFEGLGRAVLANAVVVGEGDPLLAGAVNDGLPHVHRQLAPGHDHAGVVVVGDALQRLPVVGRRRAGPGSDGALGQAEALVRHHEVGVEIEADAEAVAARAGAEGVVEGKEPGLDLLDGEARDRAGELGREDRAFAALRILGGHEPVGEPETGLQAVGEPGAERGRDHHAVHHHLDVVLALLVERGRGVDFVSLAVDLDPGEAPLEQLGEVLPVFALAPPDHRGQQVKPRAVGHRHDAVHHLAHGLALDGEPRGRRIRHPDAGEEQAQVIVNLGDGADGRARVPRRGLLLDGDRRREPVDGLHVGLLHQLPGTAVRRPRGSRRSAAGPRRRSCRRRGRTCPSPRDR